MARDHEEHRPVAYLQLYVRQSAEEPFKETEECIEIYPRADFYFGRAKSCKFSHSDPTISNKHIHIHCILFEEDEASGIPPLVYVEDVSTNGTYITRLHKPVEDRLSRGQSGTTLLSHGDQLRVCPRISFLFQFTSRMSPQERPCLRIGQRREAQLFKDRFEITNQILGSGGYGCVFAAIHKNSNRQLACKVVDVRAYRESEMSRKPFDDVTNSRRLNLPVQESDAMARKRWFLEKQKLRIRDDPQFREFEVLKDLNHPNIISLEKVFWSVNTFFIFQELVTGGDLFSYIECKGGRLLDIEAAVILRQILKAVEYLHDRDIVHRDLKPDNILITSGADGARVVLTDFGNARYISENAADLHDLPAKKRRMFTVVGTLEYAAPEIHQRNPLLPKDQGYSKAVDMWSLGSITAALLTGDVIFVNRIDPNFKEDPSNMIIELSSKCDLSILDNPYSIWETVGRRPKDFVKKLLVLDEVQRLTATQALAHEWFTNKNYADELDAVYQRSIEDWTPRRKIFRLVEALDLSRLLSKGTIRSPADGCQDDTTSRFFTFRPLAESQPNQSFHFTHFRKTLSASLPKIDEETDAELEFTGASGTDVPMTPSHYAHMPYSMDASDVQQSLSQLAISNKPNGSDAVTDLMAIDDASGDRSYDFDTYHEVAVQYTNGSIEPAQTSSSGALSFYDDVAKSPMTERKRPLTPTSDDSANVSDAQKSTESLENLKFVRHGGKKRARVA